MTDGQIPSSRDRLVERASDLFRRVGFLAATVYEVCAAAGVSKGAFFHHFASKEDLAAACLEAWRAGIVESHRAAAYQSLSDPVEKLLGGLNFFISMFEAPGAHRSCLAGTIVQEISENRPRLREEAQACLRAGSAHIASLVTAAAEHTGATVDAAALGTLWMAAVQGALILCKASGDVSVITTTLSQTRDYIHLMVRDGGSRPDREKQS